MALRDTLVYGLTIGPLTNFGLLFPVVCLFLCLAKLYRSSPIGDKGLLDAILLSPILSMAGLHSALLLPVVGVYPIVSLLL